VAVGGDELQESIDYTVDFVRGEIVFPHPPDMGAEIRAGFAFDVPVRFDTDTVQTSVSSFRAGDAPSVPVVEVRV
jgi:uncharacterized protein (TIGR02217 family)